MVEIGVESLTFVSSGKFFNRRELAWAEQENVNSAWVSLVSDLRGGERRGDYQDLVPFSYGRGWGKRKR